MFFELDEDFLGRRLFEVVEAGYSCRGVDMQALHGIVSRLQHLSANDRKRCLNYRRSDGPCSRGGRRRWTALHSAVSQGNANVAKTLLSAGADPNATASRRGNGAQVLEVRREDWTPLHEAAQGLHVDCVALLLNAGAQADAVTRSDASQSPPYWIPVRRNASALVIACEQANGRNAIAARKISELLIRHGANVNIIATLSFLSSRGGGCPSLNTVTNSAPLHSAARSGDQQLCDLLIRNGADATLKNGDGQSAERVALNHNHASLAQFLASSATSRRDGRSSSSSSTGSSRRASSSSMGTSTTSQPSDSKESEDAVRLKEEVQSLKRQLSQTRSDKDAIKMDLAEMSKDRDALYGQLEQLRKDNEALKSQHSAIHTEAGEEPQTSCRDIACQTEEDLKTHDSNNDDSTELATWAEEVKQVQHFCKHTEETLAELHRLEGAVQECLHCCMETNDPWEPCDLSCLSAELRELLHQRDKAVASLQEIEIPAVLFDEVSVCPSVAQRAFGAIKEHSEKLTSFLSNILPSIVDGIESTAQGQPSSPSTETHVELFSSTDHLIQQKTNLTSMQKEMTRLESMVLTTTARPLFYKLVETRNGYSRYEEHNAVQRLIGKARSLKGELTMANLDLQYVQTKVEHLIAAGQTHELTEHLERRNALQNTAKALREQRQRLLSRLSRVANTSNPELFLLLADQLGLPKTGIIRRMLGEYDFEGAFYLNGGRHELRVVKFQDAPCVLKKFTLTERSDRRRLERQLGAWTTLQRAHVPHIISVDAIVTEDSGKDPLTVYLHLPYMNAGHLGQWLENHAQSITRCKLQSVLRMILEALKDVHRLKVVHMDVKPENILMTPDDMPLLADFDVSLSLEKRAQTVTQTAARSGTLAYMAPELKQSAESGIASANGVPEPSSACDMYSFGILMGQIYKRFENDLSRDLVKELTQHDPTQRLTAAQALQHPFFRLENYELTAEMAGPQHAPWRIPSSLLDKFVSAAQQTIPCGAGVMTFAVDTPEDIDMVRDMIAKADTLTSQHKSLVATTLVYDPHKTVAFFDKLCKLSERYRDKTTFSIKWDENDSELKAIFDLFMAPSQRYPALCDESLIPDNIACQRVFHGVPCLSTANKIINGDFATLSKLDAGWYGSGIYFTRDLDYALLYARPDDTQRRVVLMCDVVYGNPFPVKQTMTGQAITPSCDAHIAVVKLPSGPDQLSEAIPVSTDKWKNTRTATELVLVDTSHILIRAILVFA